MTRSGVSPWKPLTFDPAGRLPHTGSHSSLGNSSRQTPRASHRQDIHTRSKSPRPISGPGREDCLQALGRGSKPRDGLEGILPLSPHSQHIPDDSCIHHLRLPGGLPLNPQGFPGFSLDLAFMQVISFGTNTNLQHYNGEGVCNQLPNCYPLNNTPGLSYLSQMTAVQFLQFTSATTGICVAAAMI